MTLNFDIIETPRLFLKGISPEYMQHIFENHSKPGIKNILGHRSEEEYLKEEYKYKNGYATYNRRFNLFLLEDKETVAIIGRCGLHNWNTDHKRAEIGYIMTDENYKKKGLMSEAVEAIIDHGFRVMDLNRVEALVGTENIPSLRLLEKNNFTREGLLRQHHYADGKYEDSIFFSKLRHEHIK